jgi:hypothetical protein
MITDEFKEVALELNSLSKTTLYGRMESGNGLGNAEAIDAILK